MSAAAPASATLRAGRARQQRGHGRGHDGRPARRSQLPAAATTTAATAEAGQGDGRAQRQRRAERGGQPALPPRKPSCRDSTWPATTATRQAATAASAQTGGVGQATASAPLARSSRNISAPPGAGDAPGVAGPGGCRCSGRTSAPADPARQQGAARRGSRAGSCGDDQRSGDASAPVVRERPPGRGGRSLESESAPICGGRGERAHLSDAAGCRPAAGQCAGGSQPSSTGGVQSVPTVASPPPTSRAPAGGTCSACALSWMP